MSNNSLALNVNCMEPPDTTRSDAGVAGMGILLAFIITAALALSLSSWIVLSELRSNCRSSRSITRKILSGFSDQQIVEGIAIQVVGLAQINRMVPYHFFIIWMLSLLSTATNFAALLALVQDFKRDWVLRWLRQLAMFVNLVLTIIFGVFVLQTNLKSMSPTLPVACVWQDHARTEQPQASSPVSVIGTIAVIAASSIIFVLGTWYLHMRRQVWGGVVRCVGLLVLMAIALGATVRVIISAQAFEIGERSVELSDNGAGEREWSFGQLLTMLLLILPFISALEILRGELRVPQANAHADSDQLPLTGGDGAELKPVSDNRYTYQPNPLFRK